MGIDPLRFSAMSTLFPTLFNCFCDSDGPVAAFDLNLKKSGLPADKFKHLPGTYLWLPVTPGAAEAIAELKELDDANVLRLWIATKTPSGSPYAYTEKILWYRQNFPWLEDRIILTHDKSLLGTEKDILVDDRPHKANADKFRGMFMLFDVNAPLESWASVMTEVFSRL
jgi:5'(3')-deoxyribonucleotidase